MNENNKKQLEDDILEEKWQQESHKFVFNPFSKTIDFRHRRPTDYKLNKRVMLPKPLGEMDEFLCELKRREYGKHLIRSWVVYSVNRTVKLA